MGYNIVDYAIATDTTGDTVVTLVPDNKQVVGLFSSGIIFVGFAVMVLVKLLFFGGGKSSAIGVLVLFAAGALLFYYHYLKYKMTEIVFNQDSNFLTLVYTNHRYSQEEQLPFNSNLLFSDCSNSNDDDYPVYLGYRNGNKKQKHIAVFSKRAKAKAFVKELNDIVSIGTTHHH